MTRDEAYRLRAIVETASASLDDKTASTGVALFPKLKQDGSLVSAGTRIRWNGVLKRAAVDLWDREENNPDHAPSLWTDIEYKLGYRIAPDAFTSTNAAAMGECLWFGDVLYRSLMNGNCFTPKSAPGAWEIVPDV